MYVGIYTFVGIGDVYAWGWNESGQLGTSLYMAESEESVPETTSVLQENSNCLQFTSPPGFYAKYVDCDKCDSERINTNISLEMEVAPSCRTLDDSGTVPEVCKVQNVTCASQLNSTLKSGSLVKQLNVSETDNKAVITLGIPTKETAEPYRDLTHLPENQGETVNTCGPEHMTETTQSFQKTAGLFQSVPAILEPFGSENMVVRTVSCGSRHSALVTGKFFFKCS